MTNITMSQLAIAILSLALTGCGGQLSDDEAMLGAELAANPRGVDVSSFNGSGINWRAAASVGKSFAYVKATEGTGYTNPDFASQYNGSYDAHFIRGAYHFARPDVSDGAVQANYFIDHGGGWSADGVTLPGALDIEYNPYGSECYGKSAAGMVSWVHGFVNQYKARTGRDPVIYTTADWWDTCTGRSTAFASTNPLWVADYGVSVPALPAGWGFYTFWQYSSTGAVSGMPGHTDLNVFNGSHDRLVALAK